MLQTNHGYYSSNYRVCPLWLGVFLFMNAGLSSDELTNLKLNINLMLNWGLIDVEMGRINILIS